MAVLSYNDYKHMHKAVVVSNGAYIRRLTSYMLLPETVNETSFWVAPSEVLMMTLCTPPGNPD